MSRPEKNVIVVADNAQGSFYLTEYEEANCFVDFPLWDGYRGRVIDWFSISSPNRKEAMRMTMAEAEAYVERHYQECAMFSTYLSFETIY